MDEFENTIRKILGDTNKYDAAKAETLRKETVQMFEDKLKKVYRYSRLYLIICVAVDSVAGACFGLSAGLGSTWGMIASAVIFVGVGQSMVTIKLWYWIMNNKLNVLREMKQLQLQIAELAGKEPSDEK